jgi:hypothetical protein
VSGTLVIGTVGTVVAGTVVFGVSGADVFGTGVTGVTGTSTTGTVTATMVTGTVGSGAVTLSISFFAAPLAFVLIDFVIGPAEALGAWTPNVISTLMIVAPATRAERLVVRFWWLVFIQLSLS